MDDDPRNPVVSRRAFSSAVLVWQALSKQGLIGKYSVLGLMGSDASDIQQRRLCSEYTAVVSFFDNDPPGWTGHRRLIKRVQDRTLLRGVQYPVRSGMQGGDPADLVQRGVDVVEMIENSRLLAL